MCILSSSGVIPAGNKRVEECIYGRYRIRTKKRESAREKSSLINIKKCKFYSAINETLVFV